MVRGRGEGDREAHLGARCIERITETAEDGSIHLVENPPRLTHVGPEIEDAS